MQPTNNSIILDLGSEDGSHIASLIPFRENVTIADINEEFLEAGKEKYGFNTILLDESVKLPFEDNSFDLVYCNSVIEHVGQVKNSCWECRDGKDFLKSSYERQKKFAKEIVRVGKAFFVQTPNKYFILESHSWLPIIQFLPRNCQIKIISWLNKWWVKKTQPDWNLLSEKDIHLLFPKATVVKEKFLGMTKSIIAVKNNQQCSSNRY